MTQKFSENTYLFASNAPFIEEMFEKYSLNPHSVPEEWRKFFDENASNFLGPSWQEKKFNIIGSGKTESEAEHKVPEYSSLDRLKLVGHLAANLDPLGIEVPMTLDEIGIDENSQDLDLYAGNIGAEIDHLSCNEEKEWLHKNYREIFHKEISNEEKTSLLDDLVHIEGMEQYIHKKFPGAKRFSVEGGESSIVSTEIAINEASIHGVNEVVIGMAHRGRLNTLTKVLKKPYAAVLAEFMGKGSFPDDFEISSDVKYHMGYSSDIETKAGKKVHLSLTPNPSHLEAVNPVVAGRVRAKQDLKGDKDRSKVMGLLIHGDAAFCGQGVVAESLVLSTLDAFDTGGIFHIVINNQVGFTANPRDGHKSSRYSTEFAKTISAPIFHVNGDDVEAVYKVTKLLSLYRATFKKDAVIEIMCYRKYGHNEGDEPMYTQPVMYNIIKAKKSPAEVYANKLQAKNVLSLDQFTELKNNFKSHLDEEYKKAETFEPEAQFLEGIWKGYSRKKTEDDKNLKTGVKKSVLQDLLAKLCKVPSDFSLNSKLKKLFEKRLVDFNNGKVDWAAAEQLAFATLLNDNHPVRLIGQDAGRGTFSHRHSVLHDQNTGQKYLPLNNLDLEASYEVADSNLSEYAVMGYEFGYSMSSPNSLVIWEAQFGDFSNGAQIIFDQFISTTETKWLRLLGLVLLLPHGYEGQGPEHTSARLERMLQLCAEENMQVVYPTTPASIFHFLRRQQLRKVRKPLIVMSPKSLLRHPDVVSDISEIADGTKLNLVISDDLDPKNVKKMVICSGKVYYDLLQARRDGKINNVALIRVEQLYPFPVKELNKEIEKYSKSAKIIWCQEEPKNMGAWTYLCSRVLENIDRGSEFTLVSRPESASPATGYAKIHKKEQTNLVEKALKI